MCGIVGFQGGFSADLLARMTDAVAHRGPDGEGGVILERDGQLPTGLGHRRLAIIDLSDAGLQPMRLSCGDLKQDGLTLVFNGEIYNYRELRAELAAHGHRFTSASDSEVLLHLYEADGPAMLGRLNGIFAFAIHDARERGRPEAVERGALFLARDPLRVKPLYFVESARGFFFGKNRILRRRRINRIRSCPLMYGTSAKQIAAGERGDSLRSVEVGSSLTLSMAGRLDALAGETGKNCG